MEGVASHSDEAPGVSLRSADHPFEDCKLGVEQVIDAGGEYYERRIAVCDDGKVALFGGVEADGDDFDKATRCLGLGRRALDVLAHCLHPIAASVRLLPEQHHLHGLLDLFDRYCRALRHTKRRGRAT